MFILIAGSIGMLGVSFQKYKEKQGPWLMRRQTEADRRRRRRADEDEDEDDYNMPLRQRRRPEAEEIEEPPRTPEEEETSVEDYPGRY